MNLVMVCEVVDQFQIVPSSEASDQLAQPRRNVFRARNHGE